MRNGDRIGARLNSGDSPDSQVETAWGGNSTSAPTGCGDALRALAKEIDGMPHGQYKRVFGDLPQVEETTGRAKAG